MEDQNTLSGIASVLSGDKSLTLEMDSKSIIYLSIGLFMALFLALILANIIRK